MITTPARKSTPEEIAEAFAEVARPIIRQAYHNFDPSIVGTRIAVDVFHRFGLRARALVVRKQIWNAAALEPACEAQSAGDDEACIVFVGYGPGAVRPGYLSGRLVAVVDHDILVDTVADEENLPDTGIELPGVLLHRASLAFLTGQSALYRSHSGCTVAYEANPDERSYVSSREWRRVSEEQGQLRTRVAVRAIVQEMSDLLAGWAHS